MNIFGNKEIDRLNESFSVYRKESNDRVMSMADTISDLKSQLQQGDDTIQKLKKECSDLKKQLDLAKDPVSNENSVTLIIDDNLDKVTPIVRYKETAKEKLIELGYITDAALIKDNFAIQLGLMTIANEAVAQIIESFEE